MLQFKGKVHFWNESPYCHLLLHLLHVEKHSQSAQTGLPLGKLEPEVVPVGIIFHLFAVGGHLVHGTSLGLGLCKFRLRYMQWVCHILSSCCCLHSLSYRSTPFASMYLASKSSLGCPLAMASELLGFPVKSLCIMGKSYWDEGNCLATVQWVKNPTLNINMQKASRAFFFPIGHIVHIDAYCSSIYEDITSSA